MKIRLSTLKGLVMVLLFSGCVASGGRVSSLFFSVQDDKKLGKQVSEEIESKPGEYPVLPKSKYPQAYKYLESMRDRILNSGQVTYKDDFDWELKIIQDDEVLNAFATPGGYIYVYTGLIKYLEEADDLAGVMGHEIAHADRRHSIKQLEKQYGISLLLSIALGENAGQLSQVVGQLAGTGAILAFSRSAEAEADDYSVQYLSQTTYACNGAASFFKKLQEEGSGGRTPEFLSTHPSPSNRVEDINSKARRLGCSTSLSKETGMTYAEFKKSLP